MQKVLSDRNSKSSLMKLFIVFALTAALPVIVQACSCARGPFCSSTSGADVVVQGEILSRAVQGREHVYRIQTISTFKTDTLSWLKSFDVWTSKSSASCGMHLKVGHRYLLVLRRRRDDDALTINLCSQSKLMSELTPHDLKVLLNSGRCVKREPEGSCNAKQKRQCGKFQKCMIQPTCEDICAPGVCKKGETCKLETVQCIRAPCPQVRRCVPKNKKCPIIRCTEEYRPVCGSDKQTYSNKCTFEAARCKKPYLKKLHDGPCTKVISNKPEPKCPPTICTYEYSPVCGSDGTTYSNACRLNAVRKCSNRALFKVHDGKCGSGSGSRPPQRIPFRYPLKP